MISLKFFAEIFPGQFGLWTSAPKSLDFPSLEGLEEVFAAPRTPGYPAEHPDPLSPAGFSLKLVYTKVGRPPVNMHSLLFFFDERNRNWFTKNQNTQL